VGARCGKSARRVLLGAGGVSLRSTDRHLPERYVELRAAGRSRPPKGGGASLCRSRPSVEFLSYLGFKGGLSSRTYGAGGARWAVCIVLTGRKILHVWVGSSSRPVT
jgi:hypothetical protein